jgi:hypothetical protein
MSDFAKNVLMMVLTTVAGQSVTVAVLSANMTNIEKNQVKIEGKLNKFDERIRKNEINNALLASN